MERLVSDPKRCYDFIQRYEPLAWTEGMKGIGLERDGELVAAVMYEGWSGPNIWMHTAKAPGVTFTSRAFYTMVFAYPFDQLGARRVTAYVEEANVAATRLVKHLGFRPEARLEGVARSGGDVIIHRMWRDDCRFVARSA